MAYYNNIGSVCYLPQPPRLWSRVQNSCTFEPNIDDGTGFVQLPYTKQVVPAAQLGYHMAMLNKGNILQYKANSAGLTKAQRYSKIAKGQWVNRNTTWGTQSMSGYSNPNTLSLKRVGNIVNIAIDPITGQNLGPTTLPVTCLQPIVPNNPVLPDNSQTSSDTPSVPPPPPPPGPPGPDILPVVPRIVPVDPLVIQDGGTLVCSVRENICTGEIVETISQQLCNLTTDSDVPGPIQELCWNDGTPTWYPKQRYIMTNSGNKWPNSSGGQDDVSLQSAIRPSVPVIENVTIDDTTNIITLNWRQSDVCLPVSSYLVFENDVQIFEVSGTFNTVNFYAKESGIYTYYMYALSGTIMSDKSNVETLIVII